MRHFLSRAVIIFSLFMLVVLFGCKGNHGAATLKIGEIDPLSGKLAKHGLEIHEGIVVAVEQINAQGGIGGKSIELITRDDQSRPEVAHAHVQELIQRQGVVALVGGYVDTLVGVISEGAYKHHIPYVAAASLQVELTRRENPYFFRISHLNGFVEPVVQFVNGVIKPRQVGILYASTPGSEEFAKAIITHLEAKGIQIPLKEKFHPGISDFSPIIFKMVRDNLDFVISAGFLPDHILLIRQLKENHYHLKGYLGPWGIAYPDFISEMKEDSELLFSTCSWNPGICLPGTESLSEKFTKIFKKRFHRTPNTTNMHGYTAAFVLIKALEVVSKRDGNYSGAALRTAIAATDLLLPMEHVVFDAHGDPLYYHHVIVQIQNGKFVVVYPPSRATGKVIYPENTTPEINE